MIATFKETLASIKDLDYGQVIIKKTVKECLVYWTKYLILVSIIGLFLALAATVYYVPQLPKLLAENLPDIELAIKNGQASSSAIQPFVRGTQDFAFIVDTSSQPTSLDQYAQGILITKDKFYIKENKQTRTNDLKDIVDNASYKKPEILTWVHNYQNKILITSLGVVSLISLILIVVTWLWKVIGFTILTSLLWIIIKITKQPLSYVNAFKIIVYASVLPFLVSTLAIFSPGWFADLLVTGLLVFYTVSWTKNLFKVSPPLN